MRYTVVVKEIIDSKGNYKRQRFNNVNKRIIKFLLKHNFSFMVAIANNVVNRESAYKYIEVFLKTDHAFVGRKKAKENAWLNYYLLKKLGGKPTIPTWTEFYD